MWYILYVPRKKYPGKVKKKISSDDEEQQQKREMMVSFFIFLYKMNNRTTIPYNQRLSEYPNKVRNIHLKNSEMIFSEYESLLQNLTHICREFVGYLSLKILSEP